MCKHLLCGKKTFVLQNLKVKVLTKIFQFLKVYDIILIFKINKYMF